MIYRLLTLLAVVFVIGVAPSQSQDRSPLSITGDVGGGAALHSLSFTQFPSVPNCCVTFGTTWSWTALAGIGIEYRSGVRMPGGTLSVGATAGVQMLPAALREQEGGINIIDGQNVREGVVGHELDLSYMMVTMRPYVVVPIASDVSAMVGLQAGVPLSPSIDQVQRLLSPAGYQFENGSQTRNAFSGALPNATGLMMAADLGVRYDLHINDALTIAPTLRYQLPLTPITSAVSWSASTITGGVQVRWQLSKPEPPPPPPPPPPVPTPPAPPVATKPVLRSSALLVSTVSGTREVNGELQIPARDVVRHDTLLRVYPAVFFEARSNEPLGASTPEGIASYRTVLQSVQTWIQQHPTDRLTIICSTSAEEDRSVAKARIDAVLRDVLVDQNRVTILLRPQGSVPYPELAAEQRRVEFVVGSTLQPIEILRSGESVSFEPVSLSAVQTLTCEAGPCTSTVKATAGDQDLPAAMERNVAKVTLSRKVLSSAQPLDVVVTMVTTDTTGATVTAAAERTVRIVDRARSTDTVWQNVDGQYATRSTAEYVLGYFDFGSSKFRLVDSAVIAIATKALQRGQRIELIARSDEFGTEDYNSQLRQRRALTALEVLSVRSADSRISIQTPAASVQSTGMPTPLTRIAQRSVRLRILADAE